MAGNTGHKVIRTIEPVSGRAVAGCEILGDELASDAFFGHGAVFSQMRSSEPLFISLFNRNAIGDGP